MFVFQVCNYLYFTVYCALLLTIVNHFFVFRYAIHDFEWLYQNDACRFRYHLGIILFSQRSAFMQKQS